MNALRIVIAEDEATIARRIARLTTEIIESPQLSFARNVGETRQALAERDADLLILDLNLQGDEGFELLRDASAHSFETIIVSAHTDRALEAFEYGVRDFVPKPFGRERLERALQRAVRAIRPDEPARYLGVRRSGATELLPLDEVMFIRGAGTRSEIVLRDGRHVDHAKMLDRLETTLPSWFERIHKSFIVNLRDVATIETHEGSRYSLLLKNGTVLPVGRTRIDSLRRKLC